MTGKAKKSGLDVGYLRTAASSSLASSILATRVQEEEQRLIHEQKPQQIEIASLLSNPFQPRITMDEGSLQQLAETIVSQGFQGVLIARPHPERANYYQITAGHRRREAAKRAGLKMLPVIVYPWTDQEMATLAATENIQREDLSPLEEGRLFQLMINEMNMTQIEVASSIKKDRGYVRNRLRLAQAPADIQAFVTAKTDSMRAVIYLLDIEDPVERAPIIEQLLERTMVTEDLPAYIEAIKQRKSIPAPATGTQEFVAPQETANPSSTEHYPDTTQETQSLSPVTATIAPGRSRELSQQRVRQVKLKTILRYLTEYHQLVIDCNELSEIEQTLLYQIRNLAGLLCEE